MLKSQLVEALKKSISSDGDSVLSVRELIEISDPGRLREYDAREEIVRNIVRAKRDLGEPMSSNFFADIWPRAMKALKGQ